MAEVVYQAATEWAVASENGTTFFDTERAARTHAQDLIGRGAMRVEIREESDE